MPSGRVGTGHALQIGNCGMVYAIDELDECRVSTPLQTRLPDAAASSYYCGNGEPCNLVFMPMPIPRLAKKNGDEVELVRLYTSTGHPYLGLCVLVVRRLITASVIGMVLKSGADFFSRPVW